MSESHDAARPVQKTVSSQSKKLGFSALLWQCSTFFSAVTSIVLTLVIAKLRGPDWYGDLATFLFISSLGAIVGAMGIPSVLAKYVSELEGSSNRHVAMIFSRRQIRTVAKTGLIAAFGVFAAMALLFIGKGYDDVPSLIVIAVSVPVTILLTAATQLSVGLQDFKSVLVATVVSKTILISVGLTVVLLNCPLFVYLSVLTMSTAIGAILQFRSSRVFRMKGETEVLPTDVVSRARSYGRTLWINRILDFAVWQQSGVFFLWLFLGSNYSGQFSVAYMITYTLISLLSGSIVTSLFPELSKLYGAGGQQRGLTTFRVGFKANALLVAPAASLLAIGGADLILILFGSEFSRAREVVFWLAVSSGFVALSGPAVSFGYALEKHTTWLKVSLLDSVLAIALFMLLVPTMGLLGAVIAQSAVQVLGMSIVLYIVAAPMKIPIPWRHGFTVVGLAVTSYLTAYLILGANLSELMSFLTWSALGSAIYLLLVSALSVFDSDTSIILRTAKTMMKTIVSRH